MKSDLLPLVDGLLDHLAWLKEEGLIRVPAQGPRPVGGRPLSVFEDAGEAVSSLFMMRARRLEECPGGGELLLVGEPTLDTQEGREVVDKILYAMGFASEAAEPFHEAVLVEAPPGAVVTLGPKAFQELSGMNQSLGSAHGVWRKCGEGTGTDLMATFDPVLLGTDRQAKAEVWKDMLAVLKRLELELPEWSRKFAR